MVRKSSIQRRRALSSKATGILGAAVMAVAGRAVVAAAVVFRGATPPLLDGAPETDAEPADAEPVDAEPADA